MGRFHKRLAGALALAATLLTLPGHASAVTGLVIGDSISAAYGLAMTDGWVALAEKRLQEAQPDLTLVNASLSGDTTGGGLRRLPGALEKFDPDFVVIELGGNDGLRGMSPAMMQQNLEQMTQLALDAGADVLLLGMMVPPNYGQSYANMFAEAFVQTADSTGAALVPFMLEPIVTADQRYFQRDGIHPTAEAQLLIVDYLMPALEAIVDAQTVADKEAL